MINKKSHIIRLYVIIMKNNFVSNVVDLLCHFIGYTLVLVLTSLIFKNTIIVDSNHYYIWGFIAVIIIWAFNKTIKPLLFWITLPITALTLGLFYPIINIIILKLTDLILQSHFEIKGIFSLFFASIFISILNGIMDHFFVDKLISTMFSIGNIEIKWYSFFLLVAFSLGAFIIYLNRKRINLSKTEIGDMLFNLVIIAILGARIYYVIFNLDYYLEYPVDILKVWEGGLAIHGGIILGLLYLFYFCKKKGISIIKLTDLIVLALPLGQAIGRWGNFFNQEAYGPVTTYSNLKSMYIPSFIIDGMHIGNNYYHPTFLYESMWCLLIFIALLILFLLKIEKKGLYTSIYLIMYGIERLIVESMRQDSLMLFNTKVAQIVSIVMILSGVIILIYNWRSKNEYSNQ